MWYGFFRIQMVCTIQLKSTPIYTFYFTENEVIVPLDSRYGQILAQLYSNYIYEIFYSITNETITLHYSFNIIQSIFL